MRSDGAGRWSLRGVSILAILVGNGAMLVACAEEHARPVEGGVLAGQVIVSGPLRKAAISVDQLDSASRSMVAIREHVGDTTTDDNGAFELDVDTYSGLLLVTARGGSFSDLATGASIQLDPGDGLESIAPLALLEQRDDVLVSPVGHLIAARTRWKMAELGDVKLAHRDAEDHINGHFGRVPWSRIKLGSLATPTTSPTEPIRAALVQAALSYLASDIAEAAGASPQEVNVLRLTQQLAADLNDGIFDGNDGNKLGDGLQLGLCAALVACTPPANESCALPACRSLCDLYAGTPRTLLAGETTKVIQSTEVNHTGLVTGDILAVARAMADNIDESLFGGACVSDLDRVPPTVTWQRPTPNDGDVAGGQIMLRVVATDDDSTQAPTVSFMGYPDTDGDLTNSVAVTTVDTRAATGGIDQPLTVTVVAKDLAGNTRTSMRTFEIDNTPPAVTIDSTGLFVDGANAWWTDIPDPVLHGTISDAHPKVVQVAISGVVIATATITGSTWTAQLPVDALSASGNDVTVLGIDLAGNVGSKVQTLRLDATPPAITVDASPVFDEVNSKFRFEDTPQGSFAVHETLGAPVDLATTGQCRTVRKYAHLLFQPGPAGTHSVLGSSGSLNPLTVNVVISDDGAGIQPGSAQYRVAIIQNGNVSEQLPWTALPSGTVIGSTIRYTISLFRNGLNAIPALGTTNGEYRIEFRAADRFGRPSLQRTCWNHIILGPPLQQPEGPGKKAEGFQRALYTTKLNPNPNATPAETGDFAAKFLNADAAGAAMWRWRIKNYLGVPVYVTVNISQNVSAEVHRQFVIRNSLTDFAAPPGRRGCSIAGCNIATPNNEHVSDFETAAVQTGLKLRARLFAMSGNETGAEIATCPGCTNDDTTQTYVFEIPTRTAPQGSTLPEYAILTYLRPTLPAGQGTDVLMAPSEAGHENAGPFGEFVFERATLTGRLLGPRGTAIQCVDQDQDENGRFCTEIAFFQRYTALTKIQYALQSPLVTTFSFAATPLLPTAGAVQGRLGDSASSATLTTDEVPLP